MFPISILQDWETPEELTSWPATRLLFQELQEDMRRSHMERRMQHLSQAFQLMANDMDRRRRAAQSGRPTMEDHTGADGKDFQLSLDGSHFSPEELTVKTEGRRLIVAGKHQKKSETETGGFFQEYREWRREAQLPEDVNVRPEDLQCFLSKDGRLHLQAPRLALPPAKERSIPITMTPGEGQPLTRETQCSQVQEQGDTSQTSS
ncbi:heat shock protein 30C-like [Hyperolius riggenbachi]|uniref:heat shock protein 30C-like n=1 Tax=Hyperolius riggenbachi TaxID=752182 RepID=UPI0035A3175D